MTWIEQNDDRVVLPVNESGAAGYEVMSLRRRGLLFWTGSSSGERMRIRRWSSRSIVSLAVLLVGVMGASCSGASNSVAEEAGDIGAVKYGGYTEEEIGVEALIANYFADRPSSIDPVSYS